MSEPLLEASAPARGCAFGPTLGSPGAMAAERNGCFHTLGSFLWLSSKREPYSTIWGLYLGPLISGNSQIQLGTFWDSLSISGQVAAVPKASHMAASALCPGLPRVGKVARTVLPTCCHNRAAVDELKASYYNPEATLSTLFLYIYICTYIYM